MFRKMSLQAKMIFAFLSLTLLVDAGSYYLILVLDHSNNLTLTADHLTVSIATFAVLVSAFAVALGTFLAIWLGRSISKLKGGAERIADGDFSRPIPVNSEDDFGKLALAFNAMAERHKDAYRRLAVERQRDEAILQSMSEGLLAVDENGTVVLANDVAVALLDLESQEAAIGKDSKTILKLYSQNVQETKPLPLKEQPVHSALSTGRAVSDIFAFHKVSGEKFLLNVSANPIRLDEKTIGAILVVRDVTKEREIDRMKTEFISLASHQLRTPLSAIKWFSEMLLSGDAGKLKGDQVDFAQNIADSTQRMIELVNSLLNISRIESGRIMVTPQPTDLKELVSGIVSDLKGKTEQKKQSLVISVHQDLPKIKLDPRLIGQVYLNLLTNAIKYTPKGGEISVFISRKGDQVISQVTDNGYGIPKDQQDRVFQKFFRAANAVKVETDGTGLGLYLIKAVIESSGGKIWFESEEGKGTTFWFSIPMSGMKAKKGEVTLDA